MLKKQVAPGCDGFTRAPELLEGFRRWCTMSPRWLLHSRGTSRRFHGSSCPQLVAVLTSHRLSRVGYWFWVVLRAEVQGGTRASRWSGRCERWADYILNSESPWRTGVFSFSPLMPPWDSWFVSVIIIWDIGEIGKGLKRESRSGKRNGHSVVMRKVISYFLLDNYELGKY